MSAARNRPLWERLLTELGRVRRRIKLRLEPWILQRRFGFRRWSARKAHRGSSAAGEKNAFLLVRIIGNDLEPRHRKGQSYDNVRFILENEDAFEACEKFWILNRITDLDEERRIIQLLESHKQPFVRVPFEAEIYRRIGWDFNRVRTDDMRFSDGFRRKDLKTRLRYETLIRLRKNLYVMNNNGARNLAMDIGRARAKWVMPWDGNCFLPAQAFGKIRKAVERKPYLPFVIVPMARIVDNELLHDKGLAPSADEEPQIIFRKDAAERFDEGFPYGRRPKVELLWRLGVPGIWDRFRNDDWDFPRASLAKNAGLFHHAGWVARLNSGRAEQEVGPERFKARSASRDAAIVARIDQCDATIAANILDPARLVFYDEDELAKVATDDSDPVRNHLRLAADEALARGPYSVVDKTEVAPSGDPHDYFHPAPHWWPDPETPSGLPYILRDGHRVPDTELYAPGSEKYDRTRLQRLFDDTTALALAATVFGDQRYGLHAADLIRTWFIDPRTRMNPNLKYAQVRAGHHGEEGGSHGIIEFKDVYFFLDAVRLVERTGALTAFESEAMRTWVALYADWLDGSPSSARNFYRNNNIGTFRDVQRAAIAAFLGDSATIAKHALYARERMAGQVAADGALPLELTRTRPLHYVMFSLQGWTTLARILSSAGDDLWSHRTRDEHGIGSALNWLAANYDAEGWAVDRAEVDPDRLTPLLIDLGNHHARPGASDGAIKSLKPVFHPDDAIAPYWCWRKP